MGALETLYALVYGKTPDSGGGSDLLGAPDRLKMYAIQKLLQGNQAISDYHDWMNDLDIEARGREGKSFDEDYLDEDARKRIAYARQKMAERRAASVAGAEKSGEVAQERGGSSYRAAEYVPDSIARPSFDQIPVGGRKPLEVKPTFDYDQFKSSLDSYVSDTLRDEAEAESQRRADSVNIDIPGGYESLQKIARQAIAKGRGGGELVFGDPDAEQHYLMGGRGAEWPFEVSRQYPDTTGVSVPGGTFSQMGGNLAGGDTTESLRRYADEFKRNQLDIKIATIEASAPAKYRSPATNQYLDMLYKQKAEEEASSVAAMNAAANMRQAQTEAEITGPAQAEYYSGYNPAHVRAAELGVEEARIRAEISARTEDRVYWGQIVDDLRLRAKEDPKLNAKMPEILAIIYDPNLTTEQKKVELSKRMAVPYGAGSAGSERDILDVAMRGLE